MWLTFVITTPCALKRRFVQWLRSQKPQSNFPGLNPKLSHGSCERSVEIILKLA